MTDGERSQEAEDVARAIGLVLGEWYMEVDQPIRSRYLDELAQRITARVARLVREGQIRELEVQQDSKPMPPHCVHCGRRKEAPVHNHEWSDAK